MGKKKNLQPQKVDEEMRDDLPFDFVSRSARIAESSTINEENRTIEATIVTANPVMVLDRNLWELVDEILMIDGMEIPGNRQVPFLDNHNRYETADVLGSVREIKTGDGTATGTIHFSTLAEDQWTLAKERHLTDVSAGYRVDPNSSIYIERGQKATVNGKEIKNNGERTLVIRNKWRLQEVSATPIGADEDTKMRKKENIISNKGDGDMPEEAKKTTEQRTEPATVEVKVPPTEEEIRAKARELAERSTAAKTDFDARAKLMGITEEETRKITEGVDFFKPDAVERATTKLFELKAQKDKEELTPAPETRVTSDAMDNFRKVATNSLLQTGGIQLTEEDAGEIRKSEFGGLTLHNAMRAYLTLNGVSNAGWMNAGRMIEKCNEIQRSHSVTTGDLSNVFLDAANKAMGIGYTEVNTTHELLTGSDTAKDFQTKNVISITNLGDLEELKVGEGFPHTFLADSKETVALKLYGLAIGIDWRALINDDMNALAGIPRMLGQSTRRKEELLFWTFFYGTNMVGPTMGEDSKEMFHADHSNFVASESGAAPTTTTLTAGKRAMMKQTLKAPDDRAETQYTNIPPKFLIAHSYLMQDVEQRIKAQVDIDSAATNATYTPNMSFIGGLVPVFAPYLDAKMDAATTPHYGWYLMGDPRQMPAVNKVKLRGYETPTIRSKNSEVGEPLGTLWDVYYAVEFGQVNYRPVYANYGAAQS